jgi:hypothetical protein
MLCLPHSRCFCRHQHRAHFSPSLHNYAMQLLCFAPMHVHVLPAHARTS